ncbi:(2Fe-2S)-binding protein [Anaerobacillus arseniciselenatis]|uniref:(2Fe-2S)-binding protein n=1 Tax=Anaerobacillus arseniciselenatis TaxID=85682 RepID=A0A1S2LPU6_9BACI|nr:(2Fe-2S)-binding protein [Anaerobacillus arseniciselenatis]OIJ14501.1 (2Fe-2S)-binding protein [Anaerobacillus arseniciselenatis]
MKKEITLNVNGNVYRGEVDTHQTLSNVLRENLNLTGTKEGCGVGECGACTVIVEGRSINSCLVLAVDMDEREISTIEGLASKPGEIHDIQKAFMDQGAIQCGFCSPGMMMSTKALLDQEPNPTDTEIKKGLSGNLCRCTGYTKIFEAVKSLKAEEVK